MSGHSKWSTIKRKKGENDAKKGKVFTKLVREVTTAARLGGGEVGFNPRLRAAIAAAKASCMPADNIDRAVKKGTGALEGPPVEEVAYEGYGMGGVAFYVEAQTDNRHRTSGDVRAAFSKQGGNLGSTGSVAYLFAKRGRIEFASPPHTEDRLMEVVLDAGAEEIFSEPAAGRLVVDCEPADFARLLDACDAAGLTYESAEITMLPDAWIQVAGTAAEKVLRLVERLEDLDDVQKVYTNFDIDEAELCRIEAAAACAS
jgi:YebC/PmpR family DNA-binding regulatory protein